MNQRLQGSEHIKSLFMDNDFLCTGYATWKVSVTEHSQTFTPAQVADT